MQKHKLYREINNIQGAINELVVVLNEFPDDIEILEILSELYLLNDQKEQAFELFKKLSVLAPNKGRIHLTLADYYRENGENKKSYNELKLAFKSTELQIDTKVRILFSYYQLLAVNEEIRNQAYELAEILIKTHPEDLKARAVFADVLYFDNRYEEAKKQYLMILESDKSKNQLWSQVLFIQAEQNEKITGIKNVVDQFRNDLVIIRNKDKDEMNNINGRLNMTDSIGQAASMNGGKNSFNSLSKTYNLNFDLADE